MVRPLTLAVSMACALNGLVLPTLARADASMGRVEVTGSTIRRIDAETELPVLILQREDIERMGAHSAAELIEKLSVNNGGGYQFATAVGDVTRPGFAGASLRALRSVNTLVLLNGRRLAIYAFDGDAVSLNDIPLEVLERVEILRDGASAIYGSDAVAGVINFITVKSYQGGRAGVSFSSPQHAGGRFRDGRFSLGVGDIDNDKFNLLLTAGAAKQEAIRASQRDFSNTAYIPELGINQLSSHAYPANFYIPDVGLQSPNSPLFGGNCAPPVSVGTSDADARCRYDFASVSDIYPEYQRKNIFLRGSARLPGDHELALELSHVEMEMRFRTSPTPASEATTIDGSALLLPATSKYYPTAWLQANYPDLVGQPLDTYLRTVEAGPRTSQVRSTQNRLVVSGDGRLGSVDIAGGLMHAESRATESYVDGYLSTTRFLEAFNSGVINPLGSNDAQGLAAINAAKIQADTRIAKSAVTTLDVHGSTELVQWPAGPLRLSVGADAQHIKYDDNPLAILNSGDVLGGAGEQNPAHASRQVRAVFAELLIPVVRGVDAQLAVRHDRYSDFGSTTNPKLAARWKLSDQVLLRSSLGTGFRAPTLGNLNAPLGRTYTAGVYNDPLYDAAVGCASVADGKYCDAQLNAISGGNSRLRPEKSSNLTLGVLFEPTRDVSFGVDAFRIKQKDVIDIVSADVKLASYIDGFDAATGTSSSRYAGDVHTKIDAATGVRVIDYVSATYENLGEWLTSGFDWQLRWRLPASSLGRFELRWNGSYIAERKYRDGGDWSPSLVGAYARDGAVLRWKHRSEIDWKAGNWATTLAYNWQSGYEDYDPSTNPRVAPFETADVSVVYKGIKNTKLFGAITNVTDNRPGRSNQTDYFQVGYDPANTNPMGRTFTLAAEYKFF